MRVTYYLHRTKRVFGLLFASLLFVAAVQSSHSMTDLYQLSQKTGSPTNMSGSTTLWTGAYYSSTYRSGLPIGFTFYFDKKPYTNFSVSPSGLMSLGGNTNPYYYSNYWPNGSYMYNYGNYPYIAGCWLYYAGPASGGKVHYKLTGSAPNRVLTVEWNRLHTVANTYYSGITVQVRLYETSNTIEFWYGDHYQGSYDYYGNIGIASSRTRYITIWGNDVNEHYTYPSGGYYNYRYIDNYKIPKNTIFKFSPCDNNLADIVGNLSEGGTPDMDNGDELLKGTKVLRGSIEGFQPFSLQLPGNPCDNWTYSVSFSGPAAGDYSVSPGNGSVITDGMAPTINFSPQADGVREATMQLRISNGETFSYKLAAEGLKRLDWIPHLSQGGVDPLNSGRTLMSNIEVDRNGSGDFTPLSIHNFNSDPSSTDARVEYILSDPLNEYAISLPGQSGPILVHNIGPNETSTPTITFSPHPGGTAYGTGPQEATLTVIADDERRTFTLSGFSVAPALDVTIGSVDAISSDRNFFRGTTTCVGEQVVTHELILENTNRTDVIVDGFDMYQMDSRVQQGAPKYPMMLDSWGQPIMSSDYGVTRDVGIAPLDDNDFVRFPITLKPGERRTYYLTYVAQRPDRRYARAFLRTNCVNFFGPDMQNFMPGQPSAPNVEGLMTLEFFARGIGSALAKDGEGNLDGLALTFDPVKVGQSVEGETVIHNTGDCDLRIDRDALRPTTGDVAEFELLEVLNGIPVDNGDYLLAPGMSGVIKARFTPSRSGSRRASVMLKSNDSTIFNDGVAERGIFYLDLFGEGKAELRARDVMLSPAVIDGPSSTGHVRLENVSAELIELTSLNMTGPNADVITESTANPWPSLPLLMEPGMTLDLEVELTPASGSAAGIRQAMLDIGYGSEQVTVSIMGEAGTRTIEASPTALFQGMNIPVGSAVRRTVILTNTGTLPVEIVQLRLEGTAPDDYTHTIPNRSVIDPGGFEFIEVTYSPTDVGSSDATLVIENNGTGGAREVVLNGMASSTVGSEDKSGTTFSRGEMAPSGRTVATGGLSLSEPTPNPVHETVSIQYTLPTDGATTLVLYDLSGAVVAIIEDGVVESGTQECRIDAGSLTSGVYMLRLQHGSETLTRSISVVK